MKKGIKAGKAVIIAAACVMIFGVTAAAAGIASVVVSHNRLGSRTDDFGKLSELEEKVGLNVTAVDSFSNGYIFDHMEIQDSTEQDENGNDLESYSGIDLQYVKEGSPEVWINMDPARMYDESYEADKAQETREVNGVKLYYSCDEYLFLPATEEDLATEEEHKREEEDPHFFISYGSDERELTYTSFVTFVMDDVMYCILSFDTNMTSEEMLDMAEEIITAR